MTRPDEQVTDEAEQKRPAYNPHPGVECCPCVPRLRSQNHAAAAARDKQHREDRSDLDGLRHLMAEGLAIHRKGHVGLSAYGQASLAEALRIADEAEAELEALRIAFQRERRARIVAEDRARAAHLARIEAQNPGIDIALVKEQMRAREASPGGRPTDG